MKDHHSFSEALECSKLAIVLMARGTPTHFSIISFPRLKKAWFFSSWPSPNATFTNKFQAFSTGRPLRTYHEVDLVMLTTISVRVVTTIQLPLAPTINKFFRRSHLVLSSFHISSKASKYFFPPSFSRSCFSKKKKKVFLEADFAASQSFL